MKQSLTETVIQKLKVSILSGEYPVGEKLPTLRELAEMFDVSRSVINAAVVDLSTNGYINIVPTKWIEVADWKHDGNLTIFSDLVSLGLIDEEELSDLLEARKFLELECVRKACRNATAEDLGKMKLILLEEELEHDAKHRSKYDLQFHNLICRMSGNMVYGFVMKAFEDSGAPLVELFYKDQEVYDFVLDKHKAIARAIEEQNETKAEQQMRLLLEHGETIMQKTLQRRN